MAHSAYTPKQGAFRTGVVSLPSERSARSPTSPGRVSERQVLPLLGLGRGCSQRTQKAFGTAMRLCASLFRGVAAPLGRVICLQLGDVCCFFTLCAVLLNVRGGGGITTLGAFHTFRKPACRGLKRQTLPLLGLGRRHSFTFVKDPAGHCQYPHRYRLPAAQSPADKPPALD